MGEGCPRAFWLLACHREAESLEVSLLLHPHTTCLGLLLLLAEAQIFLAEGIPEDEQFGMFLQCPTCSVLWLRLL